MRRGGALPPVREPVAQEQPSGWQRKSEPLFFDFSRRIRYACSLRNSDPGSVRADDDAPI